MNPVMIGLLTLIAIGYELTRHATPTRRRQREARAVRSLLLTEIKDGTRTFEEPGVSDLLAWCELRARRA